MMERALSSGRMSLVILLSTKELKMPEFLIYGKRTGYPCNGEPVYDATFRALDAKGVRVTKLSDAMSYATREDAQEMLDKPRIQENVKKGLLQFDIRRAR
jgi:hypothetical protein